MRFLSLWFTSLVTVVHANVNTHYLEDLVCSNPYDQSTAGFMNVLNSSHRSKSNTLDTHSGHICEPYLSEDGVIHKLEVINLTSAMRLIASHRKNSVIPVTQLNVGRGNSQIDKTNETMTMSAIPFHSTATASQGGKCIAIYLFARWCSFSAAASPYISALARLYSSCCLRFVAVDAANDISGTTAFFGAGSVPQLIIYRPHRPLVRISPILTDLRLLVSLVNNATGFNVIVTNYSALPDEEDFSENVLPVAPIREFDPYLVIAWIHTLLTLVIVAYKFEYVRNVILSVWNYLRGIHAHLG